MTLSIEREEPDGGSSITDEGSWGDPSFCWEPSQTMACDAEVPAEDVGPGIGPTLGVPGWEETSVSL